MLSQSLRQGGEISLAQAQRELRPPNNFGNRIFSRLCNRTILYQSQPKHAQPTRQF